MRAGLRRLMPWVAAAAALLVLLNGLAGEAARSGGALGGILDLATSLSVALAVIYYLPKALRRLSVLLLWRVRRRLVITYLFVGLTPILLLALLGLIAGFGVSAEAMARIVSVQMDSTIRQAEASARALAADLARHPEGAGERKARAWLEERAAVAEALAGIDARGEIKAMAHELAQARLREHLVEAVDAALKDLARERVKALKRQGMFLPQEGANG
jgi:hypothetical protein